MASCFHGRLPWIRFAGFEFDGEQERWELYHIADDFSQSEDLAERYPDRLAALKVRFEEEAERYGVIPCEMRPRGAEAPIASPCRRGIARCLWTGPCACLNTALLA